MQGLTDCIGGSSLTRQFHGVLRNCQSPERTLNKVLESVSLGRLGAPPPLPAGDFISDGLLSCCPPFVPVDTPLGTHQRQIEQATGGEKEENGRCEQTHTQAYSLSYSLSVLLIFSPSSSHTSARLLINMSRERTHYLASWRIGMFRR